MDDVLLSDVQLSNLMLMLTIRDGILQDRAATCCRFGLDANQAERIGAMTVQQILALVTNLGHATLFPLRHDLVALLEAPLPLARTLAAAQARVPASA